MLTTIDRLGDDDLPVDRIQAAAVRAYAHDWATELEAVREPAEHQEPEHS